jgi:hypothetical protein
LLVSSSSHHSSSRHHNNATVNISNHATLTPSNLLPLYVTSSYLLSFFISFACRI